MSEAPQSFHDFGYLGQGISSHGTRATYRAGCRCLPCRSAESCYQAMRQQARARGQGDPRGFVGAEASRAHIASLMAQGLGRRQIAALAGITPVTVRAILRGQPRVTPAIAARILAVQPILAGGVVVNAYKTFDRLRILLKEGFSREQLRQWCGDELSRRYSGVTVRKAGRVKRWFDRLTAE